MKKLPAAIDLVARREKVILDRARAPGFTRRNAEALKKSGEIHDRPLGAPGGPRSDA